MPDSYNMSDVFISYSRKDGAFVKKLFDDIKATGKEVWADFEDIPKAADWWAEIQAGIDAADAFIFVISPDSVNSDICRQEIDHALSVNKRFLPVLYREVMGDADKEKVHPAVSSHNWIFFRDQDDYRESFNILIESMETDLEHNRTLTRLLVRATEWQDHNKAGSYLLQGEDLHQADSWLAGSIDKTPPPTNLHAEYIQASRQVQSSRQRRLLTLVSIGLVISLALALLAAFQTYQAYQARGVAEQARADAEIARDQAEQARADAEESERLARSLALSASSNEALADNNPDLGLVLALSAVEVDDSQQAVTTSLADAAYAPATRIRIETGDVVSTAAYADDGSIIAAGFFDGRICLYRGADGSEAACLHRGEGEAAHGAQVLWIHMSEDGTRLLSSGADNRLLLWDIRLDAPEFGAILQSITVPGLKASVLASDASFALYGGEDGHLAYWDLSSSELAPVYFNSAHESPITVIALNRENNRALTGSSMGVMKVWDIASLNEIQELANTDNTAEIVAVAFNPDSTIAVAGDMEAGLSAWNIERGTLSRTYQGHDEAVTGLIFSENGRTMFSSSWDNSIIEWDVSTGRIVQSFYGHTGGINALSLSGNNLNMVSGGFDSTLRIWQVRPIIQESQILTNGENIRTADWDRAHIISGQEDGTVMVFDTRTLTLLHRFQHDARAVSVDLHPEHLLFTVLYRDCHLGLYTVSGEIQWEITLPTTVNCNKVLFRPHSEQILVMSDEVLLLMDFNGQEVGRIDYAPERPPLMLSMAFTPDGNQLLIGENYREDMLRLIDVETGETLRIYQGHDDGVLAIRVNADGTRFLTGSYDNDMRLWDINDEQPLLLMEGHSDRITSVDFHPDGIHAVSASNDRTMRLWDLQTGFAVFTYSGHTDRVILAQFSEDGRRILTGSYDSTLIIWRFPQQLDELLTWINENRYIRELSCTERHLYIDHTMTCEGV